jgi:hypothetical protein
MSPIQYQKRLRLLEARRLKMMNVKLPRAQLFKSGTGVHHSLAGSIHGFSVTRRYGRDEIQEDWLC